MMTIPQGMSKQPMMMIPQGMGQPMMNQQATSQPIQVVNPYPIECGRVSFVDKYPLNNMGISLSSVIVIIQGEFSVFIKTSDREGAMTQDPFWTNALHVPSLPLSLGDG